MVRSGAVMRQDVDAWMLWSCCLSVAWSSDGISVC